MTRIENLSIPAEIQLRPDDWVIHVPTGAKAQVLEVYWRDAKLRFSKGLEIVIMLTHLVKIEEPVPCQD